jgi:hypothetical protein
MKNNKGFVRLKNLRKGAIFITKDGIKAVKSEYLYSNDNLEIECILLESGEYAHFPNGNNEWVSEIKFEPTTYYYMGMFVGILKSAKLDEKQKQKLNQLSQNLLNSFEVDRAKFEDIP